MLVNTTGEKKLSILYYEDGLSFCVFLNDNIVYQEYLSFKDASIEDLFKNNLYLKQTYDKSYFAILNSHYSIVPHQFYKLNSNIGWLNWDKQNNPSTWRSINVELEELNAEFIFAIHEDILLLLKEYQPDVQVYHFGSLFCSEILTTIDKNAIFINYTNNWLEIAIVRNQFQMYNFFKVDTPEDFVYYVLNAMHQYGLDPNESPLYYFGDIEERKEAFAMLQKYVRSSLPGNSDINVLKNFTHYIQIRS